MKSMAKEQVETMGAEPSASYIGSPTMDVFQDHPAAWDWRLLLAYVGAGLLALYYL